MEKSTKWIAWTIWFIAMAWGVFGVSQRLLHGELQVNYGSYIPWGLWVAGKVYLVGLGVGASLFAWIVYAFNLKRYFLLARQALLVSAIALMMGMLVIAFDLGHIWRAFEPLYRPQFNSLLAWATWLTVINLLYVILVFYLDVASKAELGSRRTLGWIGIFLGIAFSGCNGAEFAALIAHPYWNSTLGPILSIAGDLLSGFALVLLLAACFQKELLGEDAQSLSLLSRTVLGLILLVLVLQWSEYSISAWYGVGQETTLHTNVLFGSSWYLFWIGQLLIGSIIPAVPPPVATGKPRCGRPGRAPGGRRLLRGPLQSGSPRADDPHLRGIAECLHGFSPHLRVFAIVRRMGRFRFLCGPWNRHVRLGSAPGAVV